MDNATMRTANTKVAIDLLKRTFLNILQEAKEKGQPLLSPSDISEKLGISQLHDHGLTKYILSMLHIEKLVECVFEGNRRKYKICPPTNSVI